MEYPRFQYGWVEGEIRSRIIRSEAEENPEVWKESPADVTAPGPEAAPDAAPEAPEPETPADGAPADGGKPPAKTPKGNGKAKAAAQAK